MKEFETNNRENKATHEEVMERERERDFIHEGKVWRKAVVERRPEAGWDLIWRVTAPEKTGCRGTQRPN